MAEVRDIRVKTNATWEDVQAIRNALQGHSVAAEIQARTNLGLQQEITDYRRQIAELTDGEAHLVTTNALVTETIYI